MQIRVENIHFNYPGSVNALAGISVTINPGEVVGLVGENGSGKTTFARHLNGLLRPQTGSVWIGDWLTTEHSPAQIAHRVAYVFQNPDEQLFRQRVWDEVAFGPQKLGFLPSQVQQVVELSLDRVGLRNEAQLNPRDLGYSGRKRVALASALVMQTPVLVLDEPTAGLDAGEQAQIAQVLALLRQDGKTILVISHDMDFVAENVDRVMLLRQGQIALDAPAQQFFGQSVLLETSGLVAPQITRLSQALNHQQVALTVEQFLDDRKSMISSF
jgi:energy-coupling factor transport system ATP-binding protein